MAHSPTEALRAGLFSALLACSQLAHAAEPPPVPGPAPTSAPATAADACTEPLCYTASSLEAERNHLVLHDLSLVDSTHGLVHIRADRAEATLATDHHGVDLQALPPVLAPDQARRPIAIGGVDIVRP